MNKELLEALELFYRTFFMQAQANKSKREESV